MQIYCVRIMPILFKLLYSLITTDIHKFITDNDASNLIRSIICKHMQLVISDDDTMIDSDTYMDID